jgi:hypothetical protein
MKMANKLLSPGSKFADAMNLSSSSESVKKQNGYRSEEKPVKKARPFTSQSNATSKVHDLYMSIAVYMRKKNKRRIIKEDSRVRNTTGRVKAAGTASDTAM